MTHMISKEEARNLFITHVKCLIRYWDKTDGSSKDKLEGLAHSLFATFDGCSGGFPAAIDLVLRPHPEDKQYNIENDEDWIEDGMCINDDVCLHEILYD